MFTTNTENAFVLGCRSNLPIVFGTNNLERMQIAADGNVSIGTTDAITDFGAGRTTLTIKGTDSADYSILELGNYGTSGDDQILGGIYFYDGSNNNAIIQATRASVTDDGKLKFFTKADGASIREQWLISNHGLLIAKESSQGGISNQLKFTATTGYANGGFIDFIIAGSGAIV